MKASEVITELTRLQELFGDLDVKINYSLSDTDQIVCDVYEDWLDENVYNPVPPDFFVIT
jgi:hypothetical protein